MIFTYPYKQPSAYRFSLDSIYFAEFVAQELQTHPSLSTAKVLDLCAGCGVIGIQLSWFLNELKTIDFLEIQDIYQSYFHENVSLVNRPELQLHWLPMNYDQLQHAEWKNTYDFIISNPPYFQPHQGMLSPSLFKNRCRFFLDSNYENFILGMANSLKTDGKAYFLQRSLAQHGKDLFHTLQEIADNYAIEVEKIGKIRNTNVIRMTKYNLPASNKQD